MLDCLRSDEILEVLKTSIESHAAVEGAIHGYCYS
jgi:hypothetical protein